MGSVVDATGVGHQVSGLFQSRYQYLSFRAKFYDQFL
jgi:hypothetical protein